MEMRLDGKVALVTGASQGIGQAIAATYAQAGAKVMLTARRRDLLEQTASAIDGDVKVFAADAGDPEAAEACVKATLEHFGRLDILVNNAAVSPSPDPTLRVDLSCFDESMRVNLRGPIMLTRCAWEAVMAQRGGVVINISSVGSLGPATRLMSVYYLTKAALNHLTKQLAFEMAPRVRVNGIAPGLVKTEFSRIYWESDEERVAGLRPLQRLGSPQDIANAALFLASDLSSWITGQTLVIDGGAMIRTGA